MKLQFRLFFVFFLSMLTSYGQLLVKIKASRTTICSYDTIDLEVIVLEGMPTNYTWTPTIGMIKNANAAKVRYSPGPTNEDTALIFLLASSLFNFSEDLLYITIEPCIPGISPSIEHYNLEISPNPFSSYLQINNNNKEQLSLEIFDSYGKLVYTYDWLEQNTNLDLSMLKSGAYYLAFSSLSGQKAHYKVMKI